LLGLSSAPLRYAASASPAADLDRVVEDRRQRERRRLDARSQRLAVEQLDCEEGDAFVRAHIVDGQDIRMRQRGDRAGLAIESLARLWIDPRAGADRLDRDLPAQARVAGAVDLAHAAVAERLDDLVGAKLRSYQHDVGLRQPDCGSRTRGCQTTVRWSVGST
jgi:hypothetical protein